jgi:hypothetical protein
MRAGSPLDDDFLTRVKRTKVVQVAPSLLAHPATYESLQGDPKERILDDRPQEDKDIPPISLLYDGFGQFLDIAAGRTDVKGFNDVKALELQSAVDEFAQSMCGLFENEDKRREEGLRLLNKIFAARKDCPYPLRLAAALGCVATDAYFHSDDGMPHLVYDFRDPCTGNSAIPQVRLVGYFAHSFARAVEDRAKGLDGWRVPALGITVVGMS